MKRHRHLKILELVQSEPIETQEQLLARLNENGFDVTQATISRDIKELRLYKRVDRTGKTRYAVGSASDDGALQPRRYHGLMKESVRMIDYAGNTVVIKCIAGMAQAVCAAIDAMDMESVVGTVAGEDTIFLLVRQESQEEKLIGELSKMLQP